MQEVSSVVSFEPENKASANMNGNGPEFANVMQIRASRSSSPFSPAIFDARSENMDPDPI